MHDEPDTHTHTLDVYHSVVHREARGMEQDAWSMIVRFGSRKHCTYMCEQQQQDKGGEGAVRDRLASGGTGERWF